MNFIKERLISKFSTEIRWKPVIITIAVGSVVIGFSFWWKHLSRNHSKLTEACVQDEYSSELISNYHISPLTHERKLASHRSITSITSRNSTTSERRSYGYAITGKILTPATVSDSDLDDLFFSTDYRKIGLQILAVVVEQMETLMSKVRLGQDKNRVDNLSDFEELINDLRLLLEHAYQLHEQYKQKVLVLDTGGRRGSMESLSTSQEDSCSYFSASEQLDLSELELLMQLNVRRPFYYDSLKLLDQGVILYRALRTQFVGCELDIEYIGKTHCLRQAFNYIFQQKKSTEWLITIGKLSVFRLLHCLGYPLADFEEAYDLLIEFVMNQRKKSNSMMTEELLAKGVKVINFYDVVFDLMLLEAFELLSNPPSSVLSVTRHRWLSDNFKRCALDSTIWTILLAKRKLLKYPDGFYAHYYSMVGTLLPALAWGFLGPNENLFRICDNFREIIMEFVRECFICYDVVQKSTRTVKIISDQDFSIPNDDDTILNKDISNHTDFNDESKLFSNDRISLNSFDDSEPTIVSKTENLSTQNYHRQIGLRYTNLHEFTTDLYNLINCTVDNLTQMFITQSKLINNELPNDLLSNPIQPELII